MANKKSISPKKGTGQAARLSAQHLESRGVVGIFGLDAQAHDAAVRAVAENVLELLTKEFPNLEFRIRFSIRKQEIHDTLKTVDPRLGVKLLVSTAEIRPDGGVLEVIDKQGRWRVVLVSESKHQGNDVQNIAKGIRTAVMENKGQYIMPAGNAIERVHKNIQEMKNFLLREKHFPYVVFLQGSNFATASLKAQWPGGPEIEILPSDPGINRIDRVTAANYGMAVNQNYCENIIVNHPFGQLMLQAASIYSQCAHFEFQQMFDILWNTAVTSLEVLADDLPPVTA